MLNELLSLPKAEREIKVSALTYEQVDALMLEIDHENNTHKTYEINTYEKDWSVTIKYRGFYECEYASTIIDAFKKSFLALCDDIEFDNMEF